MADTEKEGAAEGEAGSAETRGKGIAAVMTKDGSFIVFP